MKMFDFIKQVFSGKTISRILFNRQVERHCRGLEGVCVDLASGKNPSYARYWDLKCDKFIRTDYTEENNPDVVLDLDKPFPLADNFADNVFLFNALYILKNPEDTLGEVFRILKPEGRLFLSSPFVANEMPEPHDYSRFTSEKLRDMLEQAGFTDIKIIPFGERFSASAYLLHSFFIFNFSRFFVYIAALGLDKLIPKKIKKLHPCPIGYFITGKKLCAL